MFGIEKIFQSNHVSFKSPAAVQAVFRASKLRVFYHAGVDFSREGTGTPRANLLSGLSKTWFLLLQYCEPQVDPRGQWRDKHWEACLTTDVRLSEKLKSLFVTLAALFLESTKTSECDQGLGVDLGVSRYSDSNFGVVSWLTMVIRSEKAFFFNYGSHLWACCSDLRRTAYRF